MSENIALREPHLYYFAVDISDKGHNHTRFFLHFPETDITRLAGSILYGARGYPRGSLAALAVELSEEWVSGFNSAHYIPGGNEGRRLSEGKTVRKLDTFELGLLHQMIKYEKGHNRYQPAIYSFPRPSA